MPFRNSLIALAITAALAPTALAQNATLKAPIAASAPTAVPALIPYSGTVADTKTAETTITFLIYKEEAGGEPLFTESQSVATDAAGHYKVQLGTSLPSGLPADLFSTGEARWLEVQIAGEKPQPRVLLASVPYALKAADAATLGGLPASAFALAGTIGQAGAGALGVTPNANSTVTTPGGTSGYIPEFTGASTIADSPVFVSGSSVGIGTTTPAQTLDVNGTTVFRNNVYVYHNGTATPSAGVNSVPMVFLTEGYNSNTKAVVAPSFQLKAETAGNNTSAPSATFNLLYSNGSGTVETGFHFNPNGTITFASGQTFPGTGTGTITGVTAGTDLTGGGTSGNVTLKLDTTKVPTLAGNNNFTGSNVFVPSIYTDTDINIDNNNANAGNISPGLRLGQASGEGMSSKRTSGGNQFGVDIYTGYSPRLSVNAAGQVSIGTGATFNGAQLQVLNGGDGDGVYAETSDPDGGGIGVFGSDDGAGYGVVGESQGGLGGEFFGGDSSGSAGQNGIYAAGGSGYGSGNAQAGGHGVYGYGGDANGNDGGIGGDGGYFHGGYAVSGLGGYGGYFIGGDSGSEYEGGYGIYVTGGNGANETGPQEAYSALFEQDIHVNGSVVTNAQNIKIDDPADPANKYLVHTAVASSEQMNIYSGNVTTDELGVATVTLPTWFQDLNTDFRYQLTVVGGRFAQAIVSKEIEHNQFTISTNATGVKVSWQVTAVRQDPYAKAHPLVVEQVKGPRERGFYEHPELYGQPKEKQTEWGLHPQAMAQLKAARLPRPAPVKGAKGLPRPIAASGPQAH